MATSNAEISAALGEIADLLEVEAANPFRVRAYRNAARLIGDLGRSVSDMIARGESADTMPGIGADLAGKIEEIARTGRCALLTRLRKETPPAVAELLHLRGLGPKRVRSLHHELGVESVADLHRAAQQGRVRAVPGFGARTEERILEETGRHLGQERRMLRVAVQPSANDLLAHLRAMSGVERAEAAGSLRRGRETVGDLDVLACAPAQAALMDGFVHLPDVQKVLMQGPTRASVVLRSGLQVDLRAVGRESFGAAWVYLTGSKAHNIALRRLAQQAGLKINEYGVFRGARRIAGEDEASVYRAVGLPWIEPELREDQGELEAARAGHLPALVSLADLRGDLHAHTDESDGHNRLEEMVRAAQERGLRYLAVTDHSQRLAVAHGLDAVRLAKQIDRIDRLNEGLQGFRVLRGVEVDILPDGSLDLPDSILSRLDLVVGAIHQSFDLPRRRQTERVLRAMDHKYFSILAHPSGRLIGERDAMDLDMRQVIRKASERGCFLELDGQPRRLDLSAEHCRMAKDEGVLVSISSDAHDTLAFDNLAGGLLQARRGWLEKRDILNARELPELEALLAGTMGRAGPNGRGARGRRGAAQVAEARGAESRART